MQDSRSARRQGLLLLRDALITLPVLFLVFAAFDDITTDNGTDFTFEYNVLIACTIWLVFVAARLIRGPHRVLGAVSVLALAAGLWGQQDIGPGITPGLWPAYVLTTGAFLWFLALSLILIVLGWRAVSIASGPYHPYHPTR